MRPVHVVFCCSGYLTAVPRRRLPFLSLTLDSSGQHEHGRDLGLRLPGTLQGKAKPDRPNASNVARDDTETPSVSTRRAALERALTALFGLVVAGLSGSSPPAWAAEEGEKLVQEYSSPDGTFALRYPASFKPFSKPLKTHKFEVSLLIITVPMVE